MKKKRQHKILEIIDRYDIETQEELADMLKKSGYNVTQATVSRDIRELRLTKMAFDDGKQKYSIFSNNQADIFERLIRVYKEAAISLDYAGNIIVIRTLPGMAMAVGSTLDSMKDSEIVGTLAGDDTVFCIVRTTALAAKLMEKLEKITYKH